jgi:hypothetical protein
VNARLWRLIINRRTKPQGFRQQRVNAYRLEWRFEEKARQTAVDTYVDCLPHGRVLAPTRFLLGRQMAFLSEMPFVGTSDRSVRSATLVRSASRRSDGQYFGRSRTFAKSFGKGSVAITRFVTFLDIHRS